MIHAIVTSIGFLFSCFQSQQYKSPKYPLA